MSAKFREGACCRIFPSSWNKAKNRLPAGRICPPPFCGPASARPMLLQDLLPYPLGDFTTRLRPEAAFLSNRFTAGIVPIPSRWALNQSAPSLHRRCQPIGAESRRKVVTTVWRVNFQGELGMFGGNQQFLGQSLRRDSVSEAFSTRSRPSSVPATKPPSSCSTFIRNRTPSTAPRPCPAKYQYMIPVASMP